MCTLFCEPDTAMLKSRIKKIFVQGFLSLTDFNYELKIPAFKLTFGVLENDFKNQL